MTDPKPYRPMPEDLRSIDAGLLDIGGPPIPDAELPDFYRHLATEYRGLADQAETVEMRIKLLEFAERLEGLATA
jgi:hypothetical protein